MHCGYPGRPFTAAMHCHIHCGCPLRPFTAAMHCHCQLRPSASAIHCLCRASIQSAAGSPLHCLCNGSTAFATAQCLRRARQGTGTASSHGTALGPSPPQWRQWLQRSLRWPSLLSAAAAVVAAAAAGRGCCCGGRRCCCCCCCWGGRCCGRPPPQWLQCLLWWPPLWWHAAVVHEVPALPALAGGDRTTSNTRDMESKGRGKQEGKAQLTKLKRPFQHSKLGTKETQSGHQTDTTIITNVRISGQRSVPREWWCTS